MLVLFFDYCFCRALYSELSVMRPSNEKGYISLIRLPLKPLMENSYVRCLRLRVANSTAKEDSPEKVPGAMLVNRLLLRILIEFQIR